MGAAGGRRILSAVHVYLLFVFKNIFFQGAVEKLEHLLSAGKWTVNQRDSDERTALHLAAAKGLLDQDYLKF